MTLEDKDLLLKDLCARLPYGVKVQRHSYEDVETIETLSEIDSDGYMSTLECETLMPISKPYLFPLSSITEEQRNEICELLLDTQITFPPYGKLNTKGCDNIFISIVKQANVFINYCLTHHLDINGLIEKGLAIDATGLNIY